MLYKVAKSGDVSDVVATSATLLDLYEHHVEDWVAKCPDITGEPLLVIGRQVSMDDGKDLIDLLALDQRANLVVIELKRDLIGGSADLQGLRYAAMVGTWTHEMIQLQAEGYWKSTGQKDRGTFAQEVDKFCGAEYELNGDQRLILAGRDVKPRLGTMALWLRSHNVEVTVVALTLLQDEERLYLQPQVIIPIPSENRLQQSVAAGSSDKPWLKDGQAWHLEQRLSPKGRAIVEALVDIIASAVPRADGPSWNQKYYIAWRSQGSIWLAARTGSSNRALLTLRGLKLDGAGLVALADRLGYERVAQEADLAAKLAMGTSVGYDAETAEVNLNIKDVADLTGEKREVLTSVLREAWNGFS